MYFHFNCSTSFVLEEKCLINWIEKCLIGTRVVENKTSKPRELQETHALTVAPVLCIFS